MKDVTIQYYIDNNYEGLDVDLEISLFEYGLIWTIRENDYHFIYGIDLDDTGYIKFSWGDIPINCDVQKEYDWAEFHEICDYVGMSLDDWLALSLPLKINDLLSYYGYENVFGTDYWGGFEIAPVGY